MDRREAIRRILVGALCIPGFVFIMGGRPRFKELRLQRSEIPPGVSIRDGVVVVNDEKGLKIFSQKCTHLGCNINYDNVNGTFVCPCHGSKFALDGTKLKGPADKPLLKLDYISNEDGSIVVKVPI